MEWVVAFVVCIALYIILYARLSARIYAQFQQEACELGTTTGFQFHRETCDSETHEGESLCIVYFFLLYPRPVWVSVQPCLNGREMVHANPHLFEGSSSRRGGSVFLNEPLHCPYCKSNTLRYEESIWVPHAGCIYHENGTVSRSLQGLSFVVSAPLLHYRYLSWTFTLLFYPLLVLDQLWDYYIAKPWRGDHLHLASYCLQCHAILTPSKRPLIWNVYDNFLRPTQYLYRNGSTRSRRRPRRGSFHNTCSFRKVYLGRLLRSMSRFGSIERLVFVSKI